MRLDRFLANACLGSRLEVKKMVRNKRIRVNDAIALTASTIINPQKDDIYFDGQKIIYQAFTYYMLYKPKGYISTTIASKIPSVLELVPKGKNLFPCGRLDKDTEGLLLIMNDGQLAHQLLSPKKGIEKEYYVELQLPLLKEDIDKIAEGIIYQGVTYQKAMVKQIDEYRCTIVVHEGKYHEIKNIFLSLGNKVEYLKRIRMKNLVLDPQLQKGEYRELNEQEIANLK